MTELFILFHCDPREDDEVRLFTSEQAAVQEAERLARVSRFTFEQRSADEWGESYGAVFWAMAKDDGDRFHHIYVLRRPIEGDKIALLSIGHRHALCVLGVLGQYRKKNEREYAASSYVPPPGKYHMNKARMELMDGLMAQIKDQLGLKEKEPKPRDHRRAYHPPKLGSAKASVPEHRSTDRKAGTK